MSSFDRAVAACSAAKLGLLGAAAAPFTGRSAGAGACANATVRSGELGEARGLAICGGVYSKVAREKAA